MTTEEKFNAAANVIRSLPKDGAYQPAHDLKLRFYAYYKQATEGPCTVSKPGFWDVVGKMKWDAWKKLGNMSKEDAMNNYVEELKKIVETMSYNANVETFLGSLGNFYDTVPVEDIEMLLGPVIEKVRSQPGSPLKGSPLVSRETSPSRIPQNVRSLETSPSSSLTSSPHPAESEDDEEFIDTVETTPYTSRKTCKSLSNSPTMTKRHLNLKESAPLIKENGHFKNHNNNENGHVKNSNGIHSGNAYQANGNGVHHLESDDENLSYSSTRTRIRDKDSPNVSRRRVIKQNGGSRTGTQNYTADVSEPIREAVLHLQKDLDRINSRIRSLEVHVLSQPLVNITKKKAVSGLLMDWQRNVFGFPLIRNLESVELCEKCCEIVDEEVVKYEENFLIPVTDRAVTKRSWWPFQDLSPKTAFFVVLWPFVAHYCVNYIQKKRNNFCYRLQS